LKNCLFKEIALYPSKTTTPFFPFPFPPADGSRNLKWYFARTFLLDNQNTVGIVCRYVEKKIKVIQLNATS